eukprot:tig00000179_g13064.t1
MAARAAAAGEAAGGGRGRGGGGGKVRAAGAKPKADAGSKTADGKAKPLHLRHPKRPVVYLITNPDNVCYVGSTSDMARRLREHNRGSKFSYTKNKGPWKAYAIAHGFPGIAASRAFERGVKDGGGGAKRKLAVMRRLAREHSNAGAPIQVDAEEEGGGAGRAGEADDAGDSS